MITNPNQKIVTISKPKYAEGERFGTILRRAERIAAWELNDGTASHILYMRFALDKDTHTFAMSPKALHDELGISEKQYRRAVSKLIDAGFLVQDRPDSNRYTFYTIPPGYVDKSNQEPTTLEGDIPLEVDTPLQGYIPRGTEGIPFEVDTPIEGEITEAVNEAPENKNITPESGGISPEGDTSPPRGIAGVPLERDTSPPRGIEGVPLEGERNNTVYNIYNTINNTLNNSIIDGDNHSIDDEDINDNPESESVSSLDLDINDDVNPEELGEIYKDMGYDGQYESDDLPF